jgi:hypothetical protein
MTPHFTSDKIIRHQPGGLKQPAGNRLVMAQLPGFVCQNDENGLRDFLRINWPANLSQGDRMNETDMACRQFGKGLVRMLFRKLAEQSFIIHRNHFAISVRLAEKTDNLFAKITV